MGHWYNPPPPQPAAVHIPPNAAAEANPPQPQPFYGTRPVDALIRSTWQPESWPSQVLIGGGVGGWTAPVFVPPVAIAAANPTIAATIRATWLPEQWPAQRAAQIASLFATVTNTPVAYPARPSALVTVRASWLPESWYAQSEAAIASGIAQVQLPPIYHPWSMTSRMALLRSIWLPEDWAAQTGTRRAAWIPLPVTPLPTVIRHPEILMWAADTWNAQSGTRDASILASVPAPLPYQNRVLAAAVRSVWVPETWPAQTFPDFAGGEAPLSPPSPRPPSQFPVSLWPTELWPAQPGTRGAAILATVQIIVFMPFVVGEQQNVAIAQLQSLFGAAITLQYVYSGAPVGIVVAQSIPKDTPVFFGEAVTLQVSLGAQIGPTPCPIVESILVSNIPVVLSLLPSDVKVIH